MFWRWSSDVCIEILSYVCNTHTQQHVSHTTRCEHYLGWHSWLAHIYNFDWHSFDRSLLAKQIFKTAMLIHDKVQWKSTGLKVESITNKVWCNNEPPSPSPPVHLVITCHHWLLPHNAIRLKILLTKLQAQLLNFTDMLNQISYEINQTLSRLFS